MKANELKKGMVIQMEGQNILVKQVSVQTAASRSGNTLYKLKGQNIVTRFKYEAAFKGDDLITEVNFERRPVQLLFRDTEGATFMDKESYEQYAVAEEAIEEELPYMTDGIDGLHALIADGVLLGIELPPTVVLEIIETAPGMKAASASARSKPAKLTTGLVVQVPEYLVQGDQIKINTETGLFMSRI